MDNNSVKPQRNILRTSSLITALTAGSMLVLGATTILIPRVYQYILDNHWAKTPEIPSLRDNNYVHPNPPSREEMHKMMMESYRKGNIQGPEPDKDNPY